MPIHYIMLLFNGVYINVSSAKQLVLLTHRIHSIENDLYEHSAE